MSQSLWPNYSAMTPPRGMREMLDDAAGDIATQTNGKIQFYVDTVGVSRTVETFRHNCYLRVPSTGYVHLLFQVGTPIPGPWPASATTPEGEKYADIRDEAGLRATIKEILGRDRTSEIVMFLLAMVR